MILKRARALLVAGVCLAVELPVLAQMPPGTAEAYNDAIAGGDESQMLQAARDLAAAAIAHPEDPDAAVSAFEAGNQLCLRGACAEARPIAAFLRTLDGDLPVNTKQLDVLEAFANWSASKKDKSANKAFQAVLTANVKTEPSYLTIAAFDTFVADRSGRPRWGVVHERASLAAEHMKPVRNVLPVRWATMALQSASAQFNATKSIEAMRSVADVETALFELREGEHADALDLVYYKAYAWRSAMGAYYRSTDKKTYKLAEEIEEDVDSLNGSNEPYWGRADGDEPDLCEGKPIAQPSPIYPRDAARNGYVGAVILGFDFVDGAPANYRVLASVPDGAFEQASLDGMKTFRWEWDVEQKNPDCSRTSTDPAIYPMVYVLQ
ncbi:MAG: energy transducer TonB [Hyphomonas sp.]|nr:energy transducer TonB [Hyphomonas sp.]